MILILNCGSQSIKWKVYSKGLKLKKQGAKDVFNKKNFIEVLKKELRFLDENIEIVGHRVVHGGEKFRKPTKVNKAVLKELKKLNSLAPLHNPYNLLGIKIALKMFPRARQMAVFDTAFYNFLPPKAHLYPLPDNLRRKFKKFGFHGISHEYATKKGTEFLFQKKELGSFKIVSCHLGGGTSITAIKNGKAIDTSMGYTPLEGLMMMTRPGDIDPGVVIKLGKKASKILNYESGVKGICGLSDMRDVLKKNNKKTKLALDLYIYRIQKYIGAYYAILGGCDLLIFTGAIGYGSAKIRNMITKDLKMFNKTKILAIKPNEELAIAQKIKKGYNKRNK